LSNDIIPLENFPLPSAVFKDSTVDVSRFGAGIQASFAILTIKGKTWGIRHRGVTQQLTAPNPMAGNALMPVQFLDVVIVDAAESISKVYYIHGYVEGQRTPPDCWSANGVVPDPAAPHRQSATCRGCPHNVFGSKLGDTGQKGKACPDNKRLAVVPLSDIKNDAFGGPVMLRLPPGSFQTYAEFVGKMASRHYPPFAVACRLTFSPNDAYPKIVFTPLRPLNDVEAGLVLEIQKHPTLDRMLTDPAVGAFADPEADDSTGLAPPPAAPVSNVVPLVQPAAPTPPPVAPVAPTAQPVQTGFGVAAPVGGAAAQPAAPGIAPATSWATTPAPTAPVQQAPPAPQQPIQPVQQAQPQPEVLTPEQMKIRELEAQLAAAQSNKGRGRPRSKPVGPPANGAATEPPVAQTTGFGTPAPTAPVATAQPQAQAQVTPPSNGTGGAPETPAQESVGNAIANRIAGLVGQKT
jgi:hypothetical protein